MRLLARLAGSYQLCIAGLVKQGCADDQKSDLSPRCWPLLVGKSRFSASLRTHSILATALSEV